MNEIPNAITDLGGQIEQLCWSIDSLADSVREMMAKQALIAEDHHADQSEEK